MRRFPLVRLLIATLLAFGSLSGVLLPATAQTAVGASASDPVPVGTTATVGDYELTVLNVMPDASDYIMAYSEFNSEPEPGTQYFIARLQITYTGTASGIPWSELTLSASTGNEDDEPYTDWGFSCGDIPDSASSRSNELFPGGTIEINACWVVDTDDVSSLVLAASPGYSFNSSGTVWFSLGNAPMATPVPATGLKDSTSALPSSRTEPIPVGTASLVGSFAVKVLSVEPDATDLIVTSESFNEPPAAGNQFYMVTVSVTNEGEETTSPWWALTFNAVGDQAIGYGENTNSCGYIPDSSYDVPDLAPGESAEFNVCWQVSTAEAPSLVMYVDTGYGGEGRAWFDIQP